MTQETCERAKIGQAKLKAGDFNNMSQEWQPDGSVIITLTSRKWEGKERFRVRDLYGENECLLDLETGEPIAEQVEQI